MVTCIARFKARKGLLELIDATPKIATVIPRLRLLLAGTTSPGSPRCEAQMLIAGRPHSSTVERAGSELALTGKG